MNRSLGIARCGLACCLCSENTTCKGCNSGDCPDRDWCLNRACTLRQGIDGCYQCSETCRQGLLGKIKPYGFTEFIKRYGIEKLLDCLQRNENNGVVYHRTGIIGDYDQFESLEALIGFIQTGIKSDTELS